MKFASVIFLLLMSANLSAQKKFEVFFNFNKSEPSPQSTQALNKWISQNKDVLITGLAGYADSVDGNAYNKELSLKRIQSVQSILKAGSIQFAKNSTVKPYGEEFQKSKDQSQNRKVAIFYKLIADPDEVSAIQTDSISENLHELFKGRRAGDLISIRNIHFYRNREEVIPQSEPLLEQLYQVMVDNPRLSIEIHGHICCNPNIYDTRLSYRRAKYIFTYLLEKGIALNRLAYIGFGSSDPIYPIPEQTHAQQVANRRVEILIIRN